MPIGITITEQSRSTTATASGRISRLVFFVSPSGADSSLFNVLQSVTSASDLKAKYPSIPSIVEHSIQLAFLNYAAAKILVYACHDADTADATDARAHIEEGVDLLTRKTDLTLAYCVCPEMGTLTSQTDRTAIYSKIESFCQVSDWLYFANAAEATDTKQEALTERELYSSSQGHSAFYYGEITDNNDVNVPVAPVAATIAMKRDVTEAFAPPAGARYPLQGVKALVNYIDNETDYNELKTKQVNVLQKIPSYGTCIWGAQTLAIDLKFQLINTRAAISVAASRLRAALTPLLFQASDPQGRTNREVDRIIISQMTDLWLEGGLSGDTPEEAFSIVDVVVPASNTAVTPVDGTEEITTEADTTTVVRSVRKVKKYVYARFVEHVEQVEIGLFIVDTLPT